MKQEDVNYLSNFKQFGALLKDVRNLREEAIGEMHKAEPHVLAQISGKILAYDQILLITDADEVIKKTDNLP